MDFENKIRTALKQFPTISKKIDLDPLLKKVKSKNNLKKGNYKGINPLLCILHNSLYNKKRVQNLINTLKESNSYKIKELIKWELESYHILNDLEKNLKNVQDEPGLKTSIQLLITSFYDGYSEIEIGSLLFSTFGNIVFQPKLNNGSPADHRFTFNDIEYFIEVKTPHFGQKYSDSLEKYSVNALSGEVPKAFERPSSLDRLYEVLLEAVRKFDGCLDDLNTLIIIDITNSDIKEDTIDDALLGEEYLLKNNNKNGLKLISHRDHWTYFKHDKRLNKINYLIWYKRYYDYTGIITYRYRIYEINPTNIDHKSLIAIFENKKPQ